MNLNNKITRYLLKKLDKKYLTKTKQLVESFTDVFILLE